MTRKEAERLTRQADTLRALGFTQDEAEALRRISMTLHRWHERECGDDYGCIERDEGTGAPYWLNAATGCRQRTADKEAGAKKRLTKIIARHNRTCDEFKRDLGRPLQRLQRLSTYIQTDPRGAALYILRPGDVPQGADLSACYSRGICVF
ncbi:MAG: hypothetical protein ACRD52_00605 [Candidatus Acidiferrales bacterium]